MSDAKNNMNSANPRTADAVMDQVGRAQSHFELVEIRFVECVSRYDDVADGKEHAVRIGIADQSVAMVNESLHVAMRFEFVSPSPVRDEQGKQVELYARLRLLYDIVKERGPIEESDANVFGRVNGIYNAWPYLREYVRNSLVRLGLPAFELPLLRAAAAAHLAGLVDLPGESVPVEGESKK